MSLYWKLEQDFIGDDQYVGYYVPWITLGGLQLSTSTQRDSSSTTVDSKLVLFLILFLIIERRFPTL